MSIFMRRAIELATLGFGFCAPNPHVGAVVVKKGRIIGEGAHFQYGDRHAERYALEEASEDTEGADLYVTLEPCAHHGKQPPCVDIIREKKIRRVFIGSLDPNPLVSGKGIRILKTSGIQVITGVEKEQCDALNPWFFHWMQKRIPYFTYKYACSLDGKTAAHHGEQTSLSSAASLDHVHWLRHIHQAILIGSETAYVDRPRLTARGQLPPPSFSCAAALQKAAHIGESYRSPLRIICDRSLRLPLDSPLVQEGTWIATLAPKNKTQEKTQMQYVERGVRMLGLPEENFLTALANTLGEEKIQSVLIEGGGTLAMSFYKERLLHSIWTVLCPRILGDPKAPSAFQYGASPPCPFQEEHEKAPTLQFDRLERWGDDLWIHSLIHQDAHDLNENLRNNNLRSKNLRAEPLN